MRIPKRSSILIPQDIRPYVVMNLSLVNQSYGV